MTFTSLSDSRKSLFFSIGAAVVAAVLTSTLLHFTLFGEKKIGYVRSNDLVYKYAGMKESQNAYQEKSKAWQSNIDTLKLDFQHALSRYNTEYGSLSDAERQKREEYLQKQEAHIMQYARAVEDKARQEEQKMTEGVLNQINSFVEDYAKKHGYDIILGTTVTGSLLYGEPRYDITSELLEELNKAYKPGKEQAYGEGNK